MTMLSASNDVDKALNANRSTKGSASRNLEVVDYRIGKSGVQNAANYDSYRFAGPANQYQQDVMASAYKRLIGPLRGKRVLDVGCGTGRGVIDFAREAALAVGSDASVDMLGFAARKCTHASVARLVASYAQHLPFRSESFDVVTSLNLLHLFDVETQQSMVAEMKRVLKPAGILVLEFTNGLNGACIGLYRRWLHTTPGTLALPWEIRSVIGSDCRIVRVYGAPLPTFWRVFWRFPRFSKGLETVGRIPPFNHLCQRVYYKIVKEDCKSSNFQSSEYSNTATHANFAPCEEGGACARKSHSDGIGE
jgi:ubiquinone/menaquinone biosynthesis C-methylase UbiE